MEQNKKSGLLLAAVILGVCGLIFWAWLLFAPLLDQTIGGSFFSAAFNGGFFSAPADIIVLRVWLVILVPLSLLAAFVLNVLGWLKNDVKKTFVAGILYILSLTIPSAVLCFIGMARLKKQQA